MAKLDLIVKAQTAEAESVLEGLIKKYNGRNINLNVKASKNSEVASLLARIEQLERAAKDAGNAVSNIGKGKGKAGTGAVSSLVEQLSWLQKVQEEQKKIATTQRTLKTMTTGSNRGSMPVDDLNQYLTTLDTVKGEIGVLEQRIKNGNFTATDMDTFDRLSKGYSQLNSEISKFTANAKLDLEPIKGADRDRAAFDKIGNRLTDYYNKYETQLTKNIGLYNKWLTLTQRANSGQFSSVAEANREFAAFRTECRSAGVEIETFGSKLEKTFGSRMRSTLAGYGVMAGEMAIADILQNTVQVDTAMTELKKVTDETDSTYAKFLDGATDRAINLGSTLSEVVNATADYARLGYGIEDASNLADTALLYLNVADGVESIDDATSVMISTLQGFNLESSKSIDIVDKFNNVSNNYASTAGK